MNHRMAIGLVVFGLSYPRTSRAECGRLAIAPIVGLGGIGAIYATKPEQPYVTISPELSPGFGLRCHDDFNGIWGPIAIPITVSTGASFLPAGLSATGTNATNPDGNGIDTDLNNQRIFQTIGAYTGLLYYLGDELGIVQHPVGLLIGYQWSYAAFPYSNLAFSGPALMLNFPIQFDFKK